MGERVGAAARGMLWDDILLLLRGIGLGKFCLGIL